MKSIIDEALEMFDPGEQSGERPEPKDKPLQESLPPMKVKEPLLPAKIEDLNTDQDTKDDYTHARNVMIQLLDQQQELIIAMANFINARPSSRAFEVMNNVMRNASEMAKDLLELQGKMKDLQGGEGGGDQGGNTFIFNGPTDILAALKKARDVIDVTPEKDG